MSTDDRTCPCKKLPLCLSSFTAAEYGDLHALARLGSSVLDRPDDCGYTPLHLAAQNGHVAATSLLLQRGADVDGKGCGATPLHRASFAGAVSTMRLLLDEKFDCDILAKDASFGDRMTPLHKAAAGGRYLAVQLLLNALGTRTGNQSESLLRQGLHALDSMGRTPLAIALEMSETQAEAIQSVQRWDAVAGGAADWNYCAQLLRVAEQDLSPDNDTNTTIPVGEPVKSLLSPIPDILSSSCSDCGAASDGRCPTVSWEAAFRSVLESSVNGSVQVEHNLVQSLSALERSKDTARMKASHIVATIVMKENTPCDIGDTTGSVQQQVTSVLGHECRSCRMRCFALFRGKNGMLVCKSCFKTWKQKLSH